MGVYKRGTTWYIDYYAGYKRRREKIGPSKRQAETVLKKRIVQVAENRFLEVEKCEKIKFEKMTELYCRFWSKPATYSGLNLPVILVESLPLFG